MKGPSSRTFLELTEALEEQDHERLRTLLRRPKALLETSDDGLTILGLAARQGDRQAVEILLAAAADPALCDRDGRTALDIARHGGWDAMAQQLGGHGEEPRPAAPGVRQSSPPSSDLFAALAAGDDTAVRRLIAEGVDLEDPSEDGDTPLVAAIIGGGGQLVQALLAAGADPNNGAHGPAPIEAALTHGPSLAVVETLLAAGADPDTELEGSWTPLIAAAAQGRRELVELLLRFGADPLRRNRRGATARSLAERRGHRDVAELLASAVTEES